MSPSICFLRVIASVPSRETDAEKGRALTPNSSATVEPEISYGQARPGNDQIGHLLAGVEAGAKMGAIIGCSRGERS